MIALVGDTGFVGSNLFAYGRFDRAYHSANIANAYGTQPDLLIYAGVRAEKYLANRDPEADRQQILEAEENIARIRPVRLVLISTIDVLRDPIDKWETDPVDTEGLQAYGCNRYELEQWVRQHHSGALIVRLPALYGIHMKKNFIYDYMHVIPSMLSEEVFSDLAAADPLIRRYFQLRPNGFYQYMGAADAQEEAEVKARFRALDFTALRFTDSRNVYQFYPLSRLWGDIQVALREDLRLLHLATEPIAAAELYEYLTGQPFVNEILDTPVRYDYRSAYAEWFGGTDGYLMRREQVLDDIKRFVEQEGDSI